MTNTERANNLLKIVRASKALGHGSCSTIDECYSDEDLIDEYETDLFTGKTERQIVEWAIEMEQVYWERNGLFKWKEEHQDEIAELLAEID